MIDDGRTHRARRRGRWARKRDGCCPNGADRAVCRLMLLRAAGLAVALAVAAAPAAAQPTDLQTLAAAARSAAADAPVAIRLGTFSVLVDATGPTSAGYWLGGRVEGQPLSTVVAVVNGDIVLGTVWALEGRYVLEMDGNTGELVVTEVEPPPPQPHGPAPPGAERHRPTSETRPAEDGSRIDMLVVYTPEVVARADGEVAQTQALIDHLVASTNLAFQYSGVIQRINLVATVEADYVETDTCSASTIFAA